MKRSLLVVTVILMAFVLGGNAEAKSRKHSRHHAGGHGHHSQSSSKGQGKSYGGVK